MKITVNYTRHTALTLLIASGLGLSGCVPLPQVQPQMPQAYPMQPQVQERQYRSQPARPIPRAAALPGNRGTSRNIAQSRSVPVAAGQVQPQAQRRSVQRRPATPAAQARTAQAQIMVPPVLKPAQQYAQRQAIARRANTNAATRYTRPSASVSQPPTIVYHEDKKPQAVVTARKTVARPTVGKRVVVSAPEKVAPPSASVKVQPTAVSAQEPAKEVLDMSTKVRERPTASVQTEKKAAPMPAARSYSNSPAVSILVKQANNELSVGKTGRAAATLERALRIAPNNPVLWLRLAEVNEQQGNKVQAASMAKKAIGLAPDDANVKQRGQRLLN